MKVTKSTFEFRGGVHPNYCKEPSRDRSIESIPLPRTLVVSMSQHLGRPATSLVVPGEHVAKGQRIGARNGLVSVDVHAPAAGTVKAVEPRMGATGTWSDAVVIETDADQTATPEVRMPALDWRTAPEEMLTARIADAGVCGMGGAGFPTAVKLTPRADRRCEILVLNGAECEPYLSADDRVMREHADRIRTGVEIMRRILGGPAVRIAVEANKPEAVDALAGVFADIDGDVEIVVLPVRYPQGSEKHLIYAVTGRLVAPGALPISVGCIVENVATVAAVADAVCDGRPLTARVTTVAGDGVVRPGNVLAPVGTSYAELVAFCGGEKPGVRKVVSGGAMMGFNVPNLDIPTTKTTSGLLLLTGARVFQYTSSPCINCGRCLRACPMQLNPAAISRAVESDDIAAAESLGAMKCVECGACAFSCPAYRSLTHLCRRGKTAIRARQTADKAKTAIFAPEKN